ncbi:MAG TPA: metal ABC transporter substrate-binding protein [Thermoanaerobaculaceae bacterium]|nr:metal ABC transporter substrate-binding protein [Thermoanaerobaculaceae bacterium]
MRRLLGVLIVTFALAAPAAAKLKVVATIPDLADVARQIGGDLIDVSSIATGVEDIHGVPMKPSFATVLNQADVVLLLGLEAEHAFLPALLDAAKNPKLLRGAPGYVDCSVYILPLEVPLRIDRAEGDQHPMGNPHYNLDPVAGKDMARAVEEGLERNDPEHAATYKTNLEAYLDRLDAAISRWEEEAKPLKGVKLVSYHPDMVYFADRFGMEAAGTIEIKAGVSPTPRHIEELETMMRQQKVQIVVRERHYPAGLAETIAQETGAKLVELPAMVGGVPEAKDYISFIDYNVRTMLKAVQGG